jgi:polyisoprenoid-binding protein YceI
MSEELDPRWRTADGIQMRDDDLRSPRFFDAEHFPTIVLIGGTSSRVGDDQWTVDAELTIRDVSRPIVLRVTFRGMTIDARGKTKAALAVAAEIQRSDFELTAELRQESGEPGTGPRRRDPRRRRGVPQG